MKNRNEIEIIIKVNGENYRTRTISTIDEVNYETISILRLDEKVKEKIHNFKKDIPVSLEEKIESFLRQDIVYDKIDLPF